MKFEPWVIAYGLLNKKIGENISPVSRASCSTQKRRLLIAFKAYVAFMVLTSIIAFAAAIHAFIYFVTTVDGYSISVSTEFSI